MPAIMIPGYDAEAMKRRPDEGFIKYALRRALGGPEAELMGMASPLAVVQKGAGATGALANLVRQLGGRFGDDIAREAAPLTQRAINASGESAASLESMRRMAAMKQAGRQAVRRRPSGAFEPFVGDPSDVVPNPGDQLGWLTNGVFERLR